MRFHLCPIEPRIQNLFRACPERLRRPRIPIAERAQRADRNRTVGCGQGWIHCEKQEFELGTNHFRLINLSEKADKKLLALIISHLGSIFENSFVGIWVTEEDGEHPFVTVQAVRPPVWEMQNHLDLVVAEKDLLLLEFCVTPEKLLLANIESMQKGTGGKALAALYNIAKQLGLPEISYQVKNNNLKGRQFYFHTDFGAPVAPTSEYWTVRVQ